MNATTPVVSIAIRAWRRDWLGEAIASVLTQTHRDLELVIYDDAGTLEDVAMAPRDARVRYHRADTRCGASGRFRAAVALCRGDIIGVLDDDDRYEPEFVARLVDALTEDPRAGVAFCRTTWECRGRRFVPTDRRTAGRQREAGAEMLSKGWTVSPSRMLMRRAAFEAAQRAQAMPDGVAPDVFVNIGIAEAGWHHVLVDARLVICRWHADQLSRSVPVSYDTAVATWRLLQLQNPGLVPLRDRQLARAFLVRSVHRLRVGDAASAQEDLRAAAEACPSAWRTARQLLQLAAASRPTAWLAVRAWRLRARIRDGESRPPRAISGG